jgi:UDP-N-acetylglucosamine/UDP-N-acetylgalactosamine diphosphorylase
LRRDADEKVGVVVNRNGRIAVVEYTELPKSEKTALGANGELKYPVANMSNYCFSMSFIERLCAAPLVDFLYI